VSEAADSITVRVPLAIRRRPRRKTVMTPLPRDTEAVVPSRADPALVEAPARAFRYQRLLDGRRYAPIGDMAAAERIDRGQLGRILRLALLAPGIVEAILDGRQGTAADSPKLPRPLQVSWAAQRAALASPAA